MGHIHTGERPFQGRRYNGRVKGETQQYRSNRNRLRECMRDFVTVEKGGTYVCIYICVWVGEEQTVVSVAEAAVCAAELSAQ